MAGRCSRRARRPDGCVTTPLAPEQQTGASQNFYLLPFKLLCIPRWPSNTASHARHQPVQDVHSFHSRPLRGILSPLATDPSVSLLATQQALIGLFLSTFIAYDFLGT
ncbi:hypothetical protein E2C01_061093 [Portunus trituberculatus]|uniref:Uncharacterized protein n=1 Tax=Portunus trituberculatus TaxID=210409 RepID=A0A5B7HBC5_PORTR|nr:hypothetical protein [Portunus trituberculatus]